MDNAVRLLTTLLPMFYLAAWLGYSLEFLSIGQPTSGRFGRRVAASGLLAHAVYLLLRGLLYGHVPLAAPAELLSTVAFAIALVYVLIEQWTGVAQTGSFVLVVVWLLQTISSTFIEPVTHFPVVLRSPLFGFHVGSVVLGYTAFGLSAVYGSLALALHRTLKQRRFGVFFDRLPSLDLLTRMSLAAAVAGVVFLGIGIASGAVWARHVFTTFVRDPKVVLSSTVWLAYALILAGYRSFGWSQRRTIGWLLAAFGLLVISMMVTNLLVLSFHDFA
jgi:ABC-type uncharacterized transport system permease subunit